MLPPPSPIHHPISASGVDSPDRNQFRASWSSKGSRSSDYDEGRFRDFRASGSTGRHGGRGLRRSDTGSRSHDSWNARESFHARDSFRSMDSLRSNDSFGARSDDSRDFRSKHSGYVVVQRGSVHACALSVPNQQPSCVFLTRHDVLSWLLLSFFFFFCGMLLRPVCACVFVWCVCVCVRVRLALQRVPSLRFPRHAAQFIPPRVSLRARVWPCVRDGAPFRLFHGGPAPPLHTVRHHPRSRHRDGRRQPPHRPRSCCV